MDIVPCLYLNDFIVVSESESLLWNRIALPGKVLLSGYTIFNMITNWSTMMDLEE